MPPKRKAPKRAAPQKAKSEKKSKKNSNSEMKKLKRLWMKKENKKNLSNRIIQSNQVLPIIEESLKMEAASKANSKLALKYLRKLLSPSTMFSLLLLVTCLT